MSYARLEELGGIQWPCPDEIDPGTPFLHARLWDDVVADARAVPRSSSTNRPWISSTMSTRSG